jgi:hypothetical protein
MKKKLQHICFVLLVTSTSAYGGSCWDAKPDFDSCKLKAEQGDPDAQMLLGLVFKTERIPQDYQEDIKWYKKAAEQGVTQAQNNLGWMYEHGQGVQLNFEEAAKWYKKSADQGNTSAQYNLGTMYDKGQGVPQNYVIAYMFYNLAALNGNEQAKTSKDLISRKMTPLQKKEAVNITTHKIKNNQ